MRLSTKPAGEALPIIRDTPNKIDIPMWPGYTDVGPQTSIRVDHVGAVTRFCGGDAEQNIKVILPQLLQSGCVTRMTTNQNGKLPLAIIACQVYQDLFNRFLPDELAQDVVYKDYGLHRAPKRIRDTLQRSLDSIDAPSLVVLGYGLCGNGLTGLQAGKHTLLIPCVDDCIAMLIGSHDAYIREFESVPGTYYLTKGWLESGSHPLKEYEDCVDKYGQANAEWIMDQQYRNYRRVVLVGQDENDLNIYRSQAQEVAKFCGRWNMEYEEILGSNSYVRRLIEVAMDTSKIDEDFVLIPPGGEVKLEQFLR